MVSMLVVDVQTSVQVDRVSMEFAHALLDILAQIVQ
jgi:hypothetical protein